MERTGKKILLTLLLTATLLVVLPIQQVYAISWSIHKNRLTVYSFFDGQPCITQTKDGKIWVLWSREFYENQTIVYTTSSDCGATWKNEVTLVNGDHNTGPSMIQTEDGTLWLVWSSDRPVPTTPDFSLYADPPDLTIQRGSSDSTEIFVESEHDFSEPVDLTVSGEPLNVTANLDPPQVIPPPSGSNTSFLTVTVGAIATPGNYTLTVHGTSGEIHHWTHIPLEITESPSTSSSLSQKGEETSSSAQSATTNNYHLYYKTSSDLGVTWSNDTRLTFNPNDDLSPSITQAEDGAIWVVWASDRTGNHEIYCKTNNGTSWSNYIQLTNNTWHDKLPSITQAKDGKIWLIWASMETGNYEIYCKTNNGTSWSNCTRLTSSSNIDLSPTILQTLDSNIYMFWGSCPSTPSGTNDLYYMYSSDNGVSWSDPIQFTTDDSDDSWPSITQTSDTAFWVVWTSDRSDQPDGNHDIYYRTSLVGDLNEDGIVGIEDLNTIAWSFGTFTGDEKWSPDADINKDNRTDIVDLNLVARNYGAN